MPLAPPRICGTCGQPGCTVHRRVAWQPAQPVTRIRGRRLQRLRYDLFRDHPFCALCHTTVATIRDHIVPLAEGGQDIEANVQALCQACSDIKSAAEAKRGIARRADQPAPGWRPPMLMGALTARAMRHWLEAFVPRLEVQHIQPFGLPYLDRYFVSGWTPTRPQPGPKLFVHHFLASDPNDQVHSHPWAWSASLILIGGYREERCAPDGSRSVQVYEPGQMNILEATDKHRIDLLQADCWTLFLAGEYQQPWGFEPRCA